MSEVAKSTDAETAEVITASHALAFAREAMAAFDQGLRDHVIGGREIVSADSVSNTFLDARVPVERVVRFLEGLVVLEDAEAQLAGEPALAD